jgi:hypothetical protein
MTFKHSGYDNSLIAPLRCASSSSAGALGLVHSHVGAAQNAVYRVAAFPFADAKAAGDAERFRLCKAQPRDEK